MIEKLVKSHNNKDLHVKTIVKPRYVKLYQNPHFPVLFPSYKQINENFEEVNGPFLPRESQNIMRINHYWARDWKFFRDKKLNRVHVVHNDLNQAEKEQKIKVLVAANKSASSVYDPAILRFCEALRARMEKFTLE